jgi:hypothetical protein
MSYKKPLAALSVLLAALLSLAVAGPAGADTLQVRVESPNTPAGMVPLTPVPLDPLGAPVSIGGVSCAPASPAAALAAVLGSNWAVTGTSPATLQITRIMNGVDTTRITPALNAPTWSVYVSGAYTPDICSQSAADGSEVLAYPQCQGGRSLASCWMSSPLYGQTSRIGPFSTEQILSASGAPLALLATQATLNSTGGGLSVATGATFTSDEGIRAVTDDLHGTGQAALPLNALGPHTITLTGGTHVPDHMEACVTDGQDGYCGTSVPVTTPFVVTDYPSNCTTNGHDGYCGTTDTSGPVATVTNIKDKQVFKKRHGPGQVKGTLATDPNGVGGVQMRLTRTVKTKVKVKVRTRKKSRKGKRAKVKYKYKTVTHCTQWNDSQLLLRSMRRCGTKYGTWFAGEVDDPPATFSYSFALTLPAGAYVLEVKAKDQNGYIDAPATGRNVIRFTVK